ncbi:MAG: AAA family ATPase [Lachnospiraceae bacterium]|nr:AAA family ATPase [Lachnospiraceae bacterium]
MKALPVGYDDFAHLMENELYYVDKTRMIKDLLDQRTMVNLFTRPRRFGKTLNMSMLQYFFENGWDIAGKKMEYRHLFEGLEIASYGEKYMKHQGKYPVIFLTLKGAKQDTWEFSYDAMRKQIVSQFERHRFIMEDERLSMYRERYMMLMTFKAEESWYRDAIAFLSQCLYTYFGEKVIILIDEYDVPLETAYFYGFYDRMVNFIRSLFESALKTNPYLEFAVLTGCLRVSKESIFTGMNNLKIYSILNEQYSGYFGFTDQEVLAMCEYYGLDKHYERIKEWYNGYRFGDTNVYNPWSVILQVDEYLSNLKAFPESHWANSSSNSIVREMIDRADRDTKDEIEQMIHGAQLEKQVHEDITYGEIYDNMENLWNFMFFTGYFKMESMRIEKRQRYVTLSIPNEEVRYIFESKIRDWFHDEVVNGDRTALLRAFFGSDGETFQRELDKVLKQCISYYDYYENFYHGILTGILSGTDDYVVRSNRESGNGRSDLYAKPASRKDTAFIIEVKMADTYDGLEHMAEEALAQIIEKRYDEELNNDGYRKIVHYGIAFFGKDCLVKVAPADDSF